MLVWKKKQKSQAKEKWVKKMDGYIYRIDEVKANRTKAKISKLKVAKLHLTAKNSTMVALSDKMGPPSAEGVIQVGRMTPWAVAEDRGLVALTLALQTWLWGHGT